MASDYLEPVADLLRDAFSIILVDPAGCGRSRSVEGYDVDALVSSVDEVRTFHGIDRWTVGGHSFGADLALAYALERPQQTVGVFAISPTGLQNDRDWHRAYEEGRSADQAPQSAFGVAPEVHSSTLASWRRFIKRPELLSRITQLRATYLAVVGSEDPRPAWPVEQLVRLAPAGRLVRIDGAGHCPWWTHPTHVRAAALGLHAA